MGTHPQLIVMAADDEEEKKTELDWKDYVAITIASLETVLLPLVVVLAAMILLFIVIR